MPIVIGGVKAPLSCGKDEVVNKALKKATLRYDEISDADIYKTSLDARNHNNIFFVHSVVVSLRDKSREQAFAQMFGHNYITDGGLNVVKGTVKKNGRPVVVGFGPAGMFCALTLAQNGYKPIVLERGASVEKRVEKVNRFWQGGELDSNTNVQFGEGGAGTFSDGKLTTRIKDPLCRYVMQRLVEFGAPGEILTKAKPHIGTDKLRDVVRAIREEIISLGGQVFFETCFDGYDVKNGEISSVRAGKTEFEASAVILATGHSARDTFEMLFSKGVAMESKPFAIGARIEHLQKDVDESLYGKCAGNPLLPKGEYQLSYTRKDGQSAYTFCMCPGGFVVPSASEPDTVVTNGMSEFARDGQSANAALVVSVNKNDYGNGVLDGMEFARRIEKNAFGVTGGYCAPATTVGGFLTGKPALSDKISPTYAIGVKQADFEKVLPKRVCDMMREGLTVFSHRMKCFGDENALLTAPETRTSSPVRVLRNEQLRSVSISNLYPCGEGAGYAGGITSSAVDGVKVALAVMKELLPEI